MQDDRLPTDKELEDLTGLSEVALDAARTILEEGLVPACHAMVKLAAGPDTPASVRLKASEFLIAFNLGKGAAGAEDKNGWAKALKVLSGGNSE